MPAELGLWPCPKRAYSQFFLHSQFQIKPPISLLHWLTKSLGPSLLRIGLSMPAPCLCLRALYLALLFIWWGWFDFFLNYRHSNPPSGLEATQAEIQEWEAGSFSEGPGLTCAYHKNLELQGAQISAQALVFPLVFVLVHIAPLSQETTEQGSEWQNWGAPNSRMLASHLSVFLANPSPVKVGIGCQKKCSRDISLVVKIPDLLKPSSWEAFLRGTNGCWWARELQMFRRRCGSQNQDSWGSPSGLGQDNPPHEEAEWGLRCLKLCRGRLVEGPTFSSATSLFGSWWRLTVHFWERREMFLWTNNPVNPNHPLWALFMVPCE